jgi:hypothetical protein
MARPTRTKEGRIPSLRRLTAALLAVSLLLLSATAVAAAEPPQYFLDAFSCQVSDANGNVLDEPVVPAGSEVIIFEGWITKTRGQLQSFVNNVTWVLTVNGQSVDVRPNLTGLLDFGGIWGDLFFYSAGTLESGDELHTHYDNVLKAASYDGFVHWPIGSVYGGGVDCTVTVAR